MSNAGTSSNIIPLFDGSNYVFWSRTMEAHLMALGVGVCKSVINGYDVPGSLPTDLHGRIIYE